MQLNEHGLGVGVLGSAQASASPGKYRRSSSELELE